MSTEHDGAGTEGMEGIEVWERSSTSSQGLFLVPVLRKPCTGSFPYHRRQECKVEELVRGPVCRPSSTVSLVILGNVP